MSGTNGSNNILTHIPNIVIQPSTALPKILLSLTYATAHKGWPQPFLVENKHFQGTPCLQTDQWFYPEPTIQHTSRMWSKHGLCSTVFLTIGPAQSRSTSPHYYTYVTSALYDTFDKNKILAVLSTQGREIFEKQWTLFIWNIVSIFEITSNVKDITIFCKQGLQQHTVFELGNFFHEFLVAFGHLRNFASLTALL